MQKKYKRLRKSIKTHFGQKDWFLDHVQKPMFLNMDSPGNLCFYTLPKPFIFFLYFFYTFLYFFILLHCVFILFGQKLWKHNVFLQFACLGFWETKRKVWKHIVFPYLWAWSHTLVFGCQHEKCKNTRCFHQFCPNLA